MAGIINRIVLVHGIRSNGVRNIYQLDEHLTARGYAVLRSNLPIRRLIQIRFVYRKDSEALVKLLLPGDVVIGHSYGAALAYLAAKHVPLHAVFLFNGALDEDIDTVQMLGRPQTWNIFSRQDAVLWLAGLLPAHIFGRAGRYGLRDLPDDHNIEIGGGHSDVFVGRNAERWADFIDEELQKLRGPYGQINRGPVPWDADGWVQSMGTPAVGGAGGRQPGALLPGGAGT